MSIGIGAILLFEEFDVRISGTADGKFDELKPLDSHQLYLGNSDQLT